MTTRTTTTGHHQSAIVLHGSCLCKAVKFEIKIPKGVDRPIKLYQCHCVLCQKQSGSTSNTATIIREENLTWKTKDNNNSISKWVKPSGFTSHFCNTCGCPTPNNLRNLPYYWIPMGLIDGETDDKSSFLKQHKQPKIVTHICVNSKASWDKFQAEIVESSSKRDNEQVEAYDEMPPSIDDFINSIIP